MRRPNPYGIGPVPIFDPCEKCVIKMCCSYLCEEKIKYEGAKVPPIKTRVYTKGKRIKCVKKRIS